MSNSKELYKITHSSPELKTVGDYLNEDNSIAFIYNGKADEFLNIVGEDGLTNRQRIESSFKNSEEKRFIGLESTKLPLKVGTVLYIEYSKVNNASFVTEGIEVVSTDEPAFKAAKLAELESDIGYKQVNKPISGKVQSGISQEYFPDMTVWMWCRSLSKKSDENSELTGELIDLTPFVQKVSTNMGKNGGNFQLTLPPLVCELDQDNRWSLKKNTVTNYENYSGASIQGKGYVAEASLHSIESDGGKEYLNTSNFLFHNIIGSNDLIFIRFETLDKEKDQRKKDSKELFIDKNSLANRIYDMIGLVDSNSQGLDPQTNDVVINISGRDLSKLFIEDGTYFYALENSQGMLKFAGQTTQKNSQINRIFGDGALSFIGLYMFTSIEYIFKFIIQQLANIQIVPSDLFTSYARSLKVQNGVVVEYDARNKRFNETERVFNKIPDTGVLLNQSKYKKPYKEDLANGIWQIVKLVIDKSVTNRRLADSSFSTAQGSLLNFLRSAAQEPLVEFYMDTYGDQYHLIIRKPPFDQKALVSLIEGTVNTEEGQPNTPPAIVDIEPEDVLKESLMMDDSQVYSWYHFLPKNNLIGDAKNFSLSYLGALYFEEYAQVFGSKPFQQTHPYIPYIPYNNRKNESVEIYESQAISDYKYIVETNQYLPFTRKGSLVLNGDRRIKVGNVIRYKATGEIFFVDSVQQSYQVSDSSIDRITTVSVSRGLVEQLIYGARLIDEDGQSRFVSYFNLIDTRISMEQKEYQEEIVVRKKTGTRNVQKENFSLNPVVNSNPFDNAFNLTNVFQDGVIAHPKKVIGLKYLESYNSFPSTKNLFIKFINSITSKGYVVELLPDAVNRTYAQQAALNLKGSRNADAGTSKHEFGKAIDITVRDVENKKIYSKSTSEQEWRSTGIPAIANSLGLKWAGNNDGTFGTKGTKGYYIDRVHFEIASVNVSTVTEDVFEEVKEIRKYRGIDREGIFKNFKVNKFTFNFFLKKLQFDPEYRIVRSRNIYNSDQEGSLNEVIVTGNGR